MGATNRPIYYTIAQGETGVQGSSGVIGIQGVTGIQGTSYGVGSAGQILTTDDTGNVVWQSIAINNQTGISYTLQITDNGKLVTFENASPISVTVPSDNLASIPVGSRIDILQKGAGAVTLVQDSGVVINSKGGNKKTNGRYVAVSLIKTDSNSWYLVGDLTA